MITLHPQRWVSSSLRERAKRLLAVGCAVYEVVVNLLHNAVLVDHVRDAAIESAEQGPLHLPLLAYLTIRSPGGCETEQLRAAMSNP